LGGGGCCLSAFFKF